MESSDCQLTDILPRETFQSFEGMIPVPDDIFWHEGLKPFTAIVLFIPMPSENVDIYVFVTLRFFTTMDASIPLFVNENISAIFT